jgi:predicted permease
VYSIDEAFGRLCRPTGGCLRSWGTRLREEVHRQLGLPVAVALLPAAAISHAITYDLVVTLITWTIGPLLVEGIPARWGALFAALRTSPASRGLVVALLVELTPWSQEVATLLEWPARIVLLVALAVVGMRLGVMLRRPQGTAIAPGEAGPLATALAFKLLALPLLALLVAQALGLPRLGAAPGVALSLLLSRACCARLIRSMRASICWW